MYCFLNCLLWKNFNQFNWWANLKSATLLLASFGIKEVQACIWYFSEGLTLINLNFQIDYDSLENAFCSLRVWTGTSWETMMNFSYDAESLRPKKKPQTPIKRLASTIQSTSALQTSNCNTTLLSYQCQSKRGMNPPWLCLSANYTSLVRLSSINIAGMSPILRD